jgi:hypothetical protein
MRYPSIVLEMNRRIRSDLGENPLYAWVWSEDLKHVMSVTDPDGNPVYVEGRSPAGLVIMMPKVVVRKLLPEHINQWIVAALVEVDERDGMIHGSGCGSWIPVSSSNSGPVCLPPGEEPSVITTQGLIDSIRFYKNRRYADHEQEWLKDKEKREKEHWRMIHEIIKDAGTAYANAPGKKGHVSFPSPKLIELGSTFEKNQ